MTDRCGLRNCGTCVRHDVSADMAERISRTDDDDVTNAAEEGPGVGVTMVIAKQRLGIMAQNRTTGMVNAVIQTTLYLKTVHNAGDLTDCI
jgi:hypothetical protein